MADITVDTTQPPASWEKVADKNKNESKSEKKEKRGRPKGRKNNKTLSRENSQEDVFSPSESDLKKLHSNNTDNDPFSASVPSSSSDSGNVSRKLPDPEPNPFFAEPEPESKTSRLQRIKWILKAQSQLGLKIKEPLTKEELIALDDRHFDEYAAIVIGLITRLQSNGDFLVGVYFHILSSLECINRIPDVYEEETHQECPSLLKLLRCVRLTGPRVNVIEQMQNNEMYVKTLKEVIESEEIFSFIEDLSPTVRLAALTLMIMGQGIVENLKATE